MAMISGPSDDTPQDDSRDMTYAVKIDGHICVPWPYKWHCPTKPELSLEVSKPGNLDLIDSIVPDPSLNACQNVIFALRERYPDIELIYIELPPL